MNMRSLFLMLVVCITACHQPDTLAMLDTECMNEETLFHRNTVFISTAIVAATAAYSVYKICQKKLRCYLGRKLIKAVEEGKLYSIQDFLSFGADVHYYAEGLGRHPTALMCAVGGVYGEYRGSIISTLLRWDNRQVHRTDSHGRTALFYASTLRTAEQLLDYGANCRTVDNNGITPLLFLLENRNLLASPMAIHAFLSHGADPCTATSAGTTALMYACDYGFVDSVKMLTKVLAGNTNAINRKNNHGENALTLTLSRFNNTDHSNDRTKIIKILLDAKADPYCGLENVRLDQIQREEFGTNLLEPAIKLNAHAVTSCLLNCGIWSHIALAAAEEKGDINTSNKLISLIAGQIH